MSIVKKVFTCVCCVTFSIMLVASVGCQTEKEPSDAEIEEAMEEFGEALEEAMKDMENIEFEE